MASRFKSESTQSVFARAVNHHLPSSFVTLLERVDEFEIGKVLVLHKKPHIWRHRTLDFTSLPLSALLNKVQGEEGKPFGFQKESTPLFDQASDSTNRVVKLDLGLDAELKTAWVDLGGDVKGGGSKLVNLTVNFGGIKHIKSNLYDILSSQQWTVNSSHELVKEALTKGRELYVISSVYQSDKAFVRVSFCKKKIIVSV